ncbi:MAG: type II toxin-antitoxin system death-on-curing family toxin [Euryarchaeota archaeon]|nr:type II toxin-antitoxin system death-on-curing family toxin [Euryarchaeota archaeon]
MERGALLLRGICQDHPFADENKRTAFAATHMFLERNSFTIEAAPEAVRDFMLQVARIELELDGILAWLARHVEIIKVGKDQ